MISASKPFDSCAKADIIIRSSDAIDFYVYLPFLEMISPAFGKLSSSATPSGSTRGLSVVRVTDHSEALRFFLLVLHHRVYKAPVEKPGLIADICMVARKYETPTIEARMKEQLIASSAPVQKPLCVYAIATALGWSDVAKVAAKNTLDKQLEDVMTCIPELGRITGGDLYHLVKYRTRCAEVACKVVKDGVLHQSYGLQAVMSIRNRENIAETAIVEKELMACPRGTTYTNFYDRLSDDTKIRSNSAQPFGVNIVKCRQRVAQAIEEEIDKVIILPCACSRQRTLTSIDR